jgi:hypothetical protein
MTSLPNLHDSIFIDVKMDWETAIVQMRFQLPQETGEPDLPFVVIEAVEVTDLKCPRQLPWGPSIFVNSASLKMLPIGKLLTIEIQSGDVLEVVCGGISVSDPR